jgi:membrane protease YdiL (CAAX protease family)
MFVEQGVNRENKFWKYIVGSLLIILASTVGQIPLLIAIVVKVFSEGKTMPTSGEDLMKVVDNNLSLFLVLLSFAVAMVGFYFVITLFHKQTFISVTTSRKKVDWKRILFSFTLWSIFTIVSTVYSYYSSPENFVINFQPIPFVILFFISIVFIPIQTSTEEYVFRGYLMQPIL